MEPPIFGFNHAKSGLVDEVVQRVMEGVKDPVLLLNDAAYFEIRRLGSKGGPALAEWRTLARSLGKMGAPEQRDRLKELATRYAWDVAGNFDPRVYKFATRAMPPLLGALLSPSSMIRHLRRFTSLDALDDRIHVEGPIATLRSLADQGTLVFTPTHLSNLDSVVFGFALERAKLPPATYGAGKNLFSNPVLSFFMHNLGAYRVDRRLKHVLYKDVLKAYSCVLMEHGYHSLFFPGGTRSRSGGVERRLKLGLAGTGIEAFARTVAGGRRQNVYFVPATINYLLTLEAETLIDDFLQEEGKARYIIEDDESTRLARVTAFMQKLLGMDGAVVIRFSDPVDCFGNVVDAEGQSHDRHGRTVDPTGYVVGKGGEHTRDPARDAQYTRELGDVICAAFKRDTVGMSTHFVAAAAFGHLRKTVGKGDVFAMLRHADDVLVPRARLAADLDVLVAKARAMEQRGEIVLAPSVRTSSGANLIDEALRAFAGYHTHPVLAPRGDDLLLEDTRLLFYYQNRLAAHGLAVDLIAPPRSGRSAAGSKAA